MTKQKFYISHQKSQNKKAENLLGKLKKDKKESFCFRFLRKKYQTYLLDALFTPSCLHFHIFNSILHFFDGNATSFLSFLIFYIQVYI